MNRFGRLFSVQIFGESHGKVVGITIDGCPAGIEINESDFAADLLRRKAGMMGSTSRIEPDEITVVSGVFEGYTTGAPITLVFKNTNIQSTDYEQIKNRPRPGHADFVAYNKFNGYNDYRGGGAFSGRMTLPIVAAGVIAKKIIPSVQIRAALMEAGGKKDVVKAIEEAVKNKVSIGGIIECRASGLPIGWGEPFFDSMESLISHIVFAIPGIKGIEFGSGFEAAKMKGYEHNDPYLDQSGITITNNAGGINGGITNGNDLVFKVAVKPTSSISQVQQTIDLTTGERVELSVEGRHDVCIAVRMPVVIEAALALVFADCFLVNKIYGNSF